MSERKHNEMTIKEALTKIGGGTLVLPAIQRKFVWEMEKICKLFDSLMRGYPINTFMFWDIENNESIKDLKFYSILDDYCERINEDNPEKKDLVYPFTAIIDGQQRITAIKIGLRGTYSLKRRYSRWLSYHDEHVFPRRKLYLELTNKLEEEADDNDERLAYNFKFLTQDEYEKKQGTSEHWYRVGAIEDIGGTRDNQEGPDHAKASRKIYEYIFNNNLPNPDTAYELLFGLYNMVYIENVIQYYLETDQRSDRVLDVFLRTNSGGKPLLYSDLLMSFAVHHWKENARERIDELVKNIRVATEMGFTVGRDYVLKASLMLTGHSVKFSLKTLNREVVKDIEKQWDSIRDSIVAAFRLVRGFGLDDASLKSKNATIPIAYYLYKKQYSNIKLYKLINKKVNNQDIIREVDTIKKWLLISLVRKVFGGQSDGILSKLRTTIEDNLAHNGFPLNPIKTIFRGTNKSLLISDDDIDVYLTTQKDDYLCFTILALISPELENSYAIDIDHMHPVSAFGEKKIRKLLGTDYDGTDTKFLLDRTKWNSLPNLMLRYRESNQSKNDTPLEKWYEEASEANKSLALIPPGTDLKLTYFKEFYERRKSLMKEKLLKLDLVTDDRENDTD